MKKVIQDNIHFIACVALLIFVYLVNGESKPQEQKKEGYIEADTLREVENKWDTTKFLYKYYKAEDKDSFYKAVQVSSDRLNVPVEWLLYLMYKESCFKTKAKNPYASATGLYQVTKGACKTIRVNYDRYKHMNEYDQLLVGEKYLISHKKGFKSFGEIYLYLYLPAYINKPDSYRIPKKYLDVNPGYSKYTTVGSFKRGVTKMFNRELNKA
jgi:hypothetical protein